MHRRQQGVLTPAHMLVEALRERIDLEGLEPPGPAYGHMGALIVDAGLQAGLRYETVVAPRVRRVLETWPRAETTSAFLACCMEWGITDVIRWRHPDKLKRILRLAMVLIEAGVETVNDLAAWAPTKAGRNALIDIPGVGPKTVDYIARLAGAPAVAIDRHLVRFAEEAGISTSGYDQLVDIYRGAAVILAVDLSALDHRLWSAMATAK